MKLGSSSNGWQSGQEILWEARQFDDVQNQSVHGWRVLLPVGGPHIVHKHMYSIYIYTHITNICIYIYIHMTCVYHLPQISRMKFYMCVSIELVDTVDNWPRGPSDLIRSVAPQAPWSCQTEHSWQRPQLNLEIHRSTDHGRL